MKYTSVIIILLVLLSVAGCTYSEAPAREPQVIEEQLTVEEVPEEPAPKTEPIPETAPEPTPEPEETYDAYFESLPKAEQSKVRYVRNLLDEARSREENYFYRAGTPDVLQTDMWVRGDMIKRQAYRPADLSKMQHYNMVYMNRQTLKAEGYCETTKAKCWNGHGPFPESYSKWKIKTPKDWLLEFDNNFKWKLDNKIADVLYHIIDFEKDGNTYRLYINDYRGWPGKVEVFKGYNIDSLTPASRASEVYLFEDMDIGGVTEDDVTPSRV